MKKELAKKKWPVWVKILGVLSILILIFLVGLIVWVYEFRKSGDIGGLMIAMLSFGYVVVIIGMWVLGFLTRYLIKKRLYWIANIISIIGLIVFSIFFSQMLIPGITKPSFFGSIWAFILASGWAIIPIIYFIISLVLISKARKGKIGALISRYVTSPISREHEKIKSKTEKTIKEFKTGEKPSNWWCLLPILLGIIGGVIGYFLFRNRDRKFAKRLLIIGVVMFAVWIVLQIILGVLVYWSF